MAAAVVLVVLGWALARDLGRWVEPCAVPPHRPGHRGDGLVPDPASFLAIAGLSALRIAGLEPRTLAVGGAITAVVFGLAAQQTLGNLIAGMVLISARPFRIGDRVRLQGGGLAGQIEGTVASLGLLYVTFAQGEDSIMVPNNVVLTSAVVPLREPAAVDLRARLRPDVKPSEVQKLLETGVRIPVRAEPHISLEEIDSDEVIVRIAATPESEADGPRLADEVLSAIASRHPRGRHRRAHGRAPGRRRRPRAWRTARTAAAPREHMAAESPPSACPAGPPPSPAMTRRSRAGAAGARPSSGSEPGRPRRPSRSGSGATSISERLRSIALTTAAATCSGVLSAT